MTDRLAGILVTLEKDIREDDAEPVLDAIRQIRGVAAVDPVLSNIGIHLAETRARTRLRRDLWRVLNPELPQETDN